MHICVSVCYNFWFLTTNAIRYMGHPNEKVARASHSLFAGFISLGKESDLDVRVSLKEQLVFHYIKRSLEVSKQL